MPQIKKAHPVDPEAEEFALDALFAAVGEVARFHGLCPTCLVYALADTVADLEDKGVIGHGAMRDDDDTMLAHFLRNVRPVGGTQ